MPSSKKKVETFKLSPELKKMAKQYRSLTKMTDSMKKKIADYQGRLAQMTQILYGTEKIRESVLGRMKPTEAVIDQPDPDPDLHINF